VGRTAQTLRRWEKVGIIQAYRTPTNRRYYTYEQYLALTGQPVQERQTIVYARVSSVGQKADLQRQKQALEQFCIASGKVVDEWLEDIGSGLNLKRKNFVGLMKQVEQGRIREIVIAHKDRLTRFGYEWFELFCVEHGATLTVMNVESLSPEQEMTQDLLAIIHSFSSRLYGLRKYKKTLKEIVTDAPHN
jgi:putative resolvase